MKKYFVLGFLFLLFSCDSDDEPSAVLGSIIFDGKEYSITQGIAGAGSENNTHNELGFLVTNRNNLFLDFLLLSPGAEHFTPGTFAFKINSDVKEDDFYFNDASFLLDNNGDGDYIDENDIDMVVTGGTITVAGDEDSYLITFDLDLYGGKSLTGGVSGAFEFWE
ncbi:hypothetical protein [Fulvivirga ligni]|uniref:hypothetical protein n=1 Tax=Fulvivirga ligni TaxID=2904246 RepID=UPI001F3FB5DA|nr:hypothetical protein [Fulvivirga ligni]UII20379.1 hypothetical protein LVD16_21285 [Fulvivirga ligni]